MLLRFVFGGVRERSGVGIATGVVRGGVGGGVRGSGWGVQLYDVC